MIFICTTTFGVSEHIQEWIAPLMLKLGVLHGGGYYETWSSVLSCRM